jgi:hypothetical protein
MSPLLSHAVVTSSPELNKSSKIAKGKFAKEEGL